MVKLANIDLTQELSRAWDWRLRSKMWDPERRTAVRIFHGPGESAGPLAPLLVDRFGSVAWLFWYSDAPVPEPRAIEGFLRSIGVESATLVHRKRDAKQTEAKLMFGSSRLETVHELGLQYEIRQEGTIQPGLFLDHFSLRRWLSTHATSGRVLNLFCYTGSLGLAAALGGCEEVIQVDLSKPTLDWAKRNRELNPSLSFKVHFQQADAVEDLKKRVKRGERFDWVLLDPPSFSRSKAGAISVAKDLPKLHELCLSLIQDGGCLVSSTNSSQLARAKFEQDLKAVASRMRLKVCVEEELRLGQGFVTSLGAPEQDRYLKGAVLRVHGLK
jgi:23S rRNA (cytosine1962-C5)-methyltransferase